MSSAATAAAGPAMRSSATANVVETVSSLSSSPRGTRIGMSSAAMISGVSTADSYLVGCAKLGMDLRIATAPELSPRLEVLELARAISSETGAAITITNDIEVALRDCDAVATDVWVSMGEPDEVWARRIELLLPFQVNARALELTGNPHVRFLHCLPAFHNADTAVGREIHDRYGLEALEVTDDVFESPASVVFDEAENRLHTIKAILVATLER